MQWYEVVELLAFFAALFALAPPLGLFMSRMLGPQPNPAMLALDRAAGRACGTDLDREMTWREYTVAVLTFNAAGFVLLFTMLLTQAYLPLNPQHLPGLSWHLAFNTAVSFVTDANIGG